MRLAAQVHGNHTETIKIGGDFYGEHERVLNRGRNVLLSFTGETLHLRVTEGKVRAIPTVGSLECDVEAEAAPGDVLIYNPGEAIMLNVLTAQAKLVSGVTLQGSGS